MPNVFESFGIQQKEKDLQFWAVWAVREVRENQHSIDENMDFKQKCQLQKFYVKIKVIKLTDPNSYLIYSRKTAFKVLQISFILFYLILNFFGDSKQAVGNCGLFY